MPVFYSFYHEGKLIAEEESDYFVQMSCEFPTGTYCKVEHLGDHFEGFHWLKLSIESRWTIVEHEDVPALILMTDFMEN